MEAEIKAMGGQVATLVGDITKEDDCSRLADLAIEKFGRINLVAPCAGIIRDGLMVATDRETGKVAKKMSLANFQAVIDINLTGVFLTVRECAGADDRPWLPGPDLPVFLHRFPGHRRPDQLLLHQGGHERDAQSDHRRVLPPRPGGQDPLRGHCPRVMWALPW